MLYESQCERGTAVLSCALLISITLLLIGCASTERQAQLNDHAADSVGKNDEQSNVDPYESFNRSMFKFNDHLDDYVAKPISDAYLWVAPGFLKTGVTNFFSNLKDINVVLNDHMQGKFNQGMEDTGRFLTNSTFGMLGLFDVATEIGLKKHEEDFGQTLAVWGVPQGSYLVLPILGPTTTRGLPGSVVDAAANPSFYVGIPVNLVSMLNTRANAEGAIKFIDEASIDPYVFTREAFLQHQKNLISDGKIDANVAVEPLEFDMDEGDNTVAASGKDQKPDAAEKKNGSLISENRNIDKSLDNALIALDQASQAFAQSSEKLDELNKKSAKRKSRLKPRKYPVN